MLRGDLRASSYVLRIVFSAQAYGKILVHKVEHKQTLAQNYFSRLPGMAEQLRSRVVASQKPRAPFVTGTAVKQPV